MTNTHAKENEMEKKHKIIYVGDIAKKEYRL